VSECDREVWPSSGCCVTGKTYEFTNLNVIRRANIYIILVHQLLFLSDSDSSVSD
jgi:hypothetical protein